MISLAVSQVPLTVEDANVNEDEDEVQFTGGDNQETVVMQSIKSVEEAWYDSHIKQEPYEEEIHQETQEEQVQTALQEHYVTRSGCVSRPPSRLIETAYAILHETYQQNYREKQENVSNELIECTYAMKALLFQKAMAQNPEEAMQALREEVQKAVKMDMVSSQT
jgi:hypothetical protein